MLIGRWVGIVIKAGVKCKVRGRDVRDRGQGKGYIREMYDREGRGGIRRSGEKGTM